MELTFEQQLLLAVVPIFLTAVLAGLVIPLILQSIETRKAESMKRLEAELARQSKIIDAQASLLDDLTNAMWRWRYLLMRVTYVGSEQPEDALALAWKTYDEKMWDSLHSIRVQITRARRLISQPAYDALRDQYDQLIDVDRHLSTAMKLVADVRRRELEELNLKVLNEVSRAIDSSLHMVAQEVQLVSAAASH